MKTKILALILAVQNLIHPMSMGQTESLKIYACEAHAVSISDGSLMLSEQLQNANIRLRVFHVKSLLGSVTINQGAQQLYTSARSAITPSDPFFRGGKYVFAKGERIQFILLLEDVPEHAGKRVTRTGIGLATQLDEAGRAYTADPFSGAIYVEKFYDDIKRLLNIKAEEKPSK